MITNKTEYVVKYIVLENKVNITDQQNNCLNCSPVKCVYDPSVSAL